MFPVSCGIIISAKACYSFNDGQAQPNDDQSKPNDGGTQPNDGQAQPNDGQAKPNDGRTQPNDDTTAAHATCSKIGASRLHFNAHGCHNSQSHQWCATRLQY